MFLAAIDGQIIYLIGAAVYGVYVWWKQRAEKKAQAELEERVRREARLQGPALPAQPAPHPAPVPHLAPAHAPTQAPAPAPGSEEARMRRFLEALGVPGAAPATSPPPQPPPFRPAPAPQATPRPAPELPRRPVPAPAGPHLPVPPIVAQRPLIRPGPPPRHPAPRPTATRPLVISEELPLESRDPGRLEESAAAIEQVSTEFDRMHAITVPAVRTALADGSPPVLSLSETSHTAQARLLREFLRNPQSLKTVMLAREVLGPPKALSDF